MAEIVARVTNLTGKAFARDMDGNVRQLKNGEPVREGDVVQTADGGRVQLTTADGRNVGLGTGEAIKLDAEVASPNLPDASTSAVQATRPVLARISRTVVSKDGTFSFDDDGGKAFGGSDQKDGHTFVELARIVETVDPLAFQFSTTRFPVTDTLQGGSVPPLLVSAGVVVAGQLDAASDSGIAGDSLTNDATPTLVGTATPGVTIEVATPFGVLTTVASAAGTWTITLPSPLPDGTASLTVTARDTLGGAATTTINVVVDTRISLTAELSPASDTALIGDNLTRDNTPTLLGTGEPGASITVTSPTGEVLTTTVAADGTWKVMPLLPLPDGSARFDVVTVDMAGNTKSTVVDMVVDTVALAVISINPITPDNVVSLEESARVIPVAGSVSGDVKPGDVVSLVVNGVTYSGVVASDLTFSIDVAGHDLANDPDHAVEARVSVSDAAGNEAVAVGSRVFDIATSRILSVTSDAKTEGIDLVHMVTLSHESTVETRFALSLSGSGERPASGNDLGVAVFSDGVTFDVATGQVVVPAGVASFSVIVPTVADKVLEPDETYTITVGDQGGTGTIVDDDDFPSIASVTSDTRLEGSSLSHTVTLSNGSAYVTEFDFSIGAGTAIAGVDYRLPGNAQFTNGVTYDANTGRLSVPSGVTGFTISIPTVDDTKFESNETYFISVGGVQGRGTIIENDPVPEIPGGATIWSVSSARGPEGAHLVHTVTLNEAVSRPVQFAFSLAGSGSNPAIASDTGTPVFSNGVTYDSRSGKITVPVGVSNFTVTIPAIRDAVLEPDETYTLTVGRKSGVGTITDILSVSIGDAVAVNEGSSLQFTVTLSGGTSVSDITIPLTYAGTADPVLDLNGEPVSVTILAGQTSATVTVPTFTDNIAEGNETVLVNLGTPPAGVTIGTGTGSGTINDTTPALTVASVSAASGNEGATLTHTVTLSGTSATGATTVSLNLAGTGATIGSDTGVVEYNTGSGWQTATVTGGAFSVSVPANAGSFQVRVAATDDALFEGSETYNLNAGIGAQVPVSGQGTILDNETPPTLAVSSVTVVENAGFAQFSVSLSRPSAAATTVSLSLAGVSATAGGVDFGTAGAGNLQVSTNGGLTWTDAASYTFAPGTTSVLVRTPIVDDLLHEPGAGETFTLTATTTAGATANPSATGTATITDNDSVPAISVSDPFVVEGGQLAFTVTLSNPSTQAVTVAYATANGTATVASGDYTAASGTLTFAPGVTTQTVIVQTLVNNPVGEANETVQLNLTLPTNATIADAQGIGTIMERIQAVADSGTVYESALATGTLASSSGETVTGNLLANDYSPGTKTVNRVSFAGTNYTDTNSDGIIAVDTPLGYLEVFVTAGTYGGIARAAGDYVYTLQSNSTAGDNVSETFTYRITDGSNTSTADLNIRIVDDAPVGSDITQTLQAASAAATYNLIVILDVSGSMGNTVTGTGKTRLQIAQEALSTLFAKYDGLGNVNIQIVPFDSGVVESQWFVDDRYAAEGYVNSLVPLSGTQYSTALNAVINGFSKPQADKTLFYFISDGEPNSGYEVGSTLQSQWEQLVQTQGDISFSIAIGGATTTFLEPISFPNTDTNGDGTGDYTIRVNNEADLAATLLQTVDGGVVVGNVSVLSGGGSNGLLLGADGGRVNSFAIDGVTYTYVAGGADSQTITTLKGGQLTVNYLTGTYSYQLVLNKTIQGEQEVISVTGLDGDGDTKTVNVVINLDYVANLDANRDIILTNVIDGSPLTIGQAALMHNDATGASAVISGTANAWGGTVAGAALVTFDPAAGFGNYSAISEATFSGGIFSGDSQATPKNNTYQTAVDLTDRARFGAVTGGDSGSVPNASARSVKFTGTLSASGSNSDDDYIKIRLKAGETVTLDVDRGFGDASSVDSRLYLYAADGRTLLASNRNTTAADPGSSSTNDPFVTYTATRESEFFIRVRHDVDATTSGNGDYDLWITVAEAPWMGEFDYTLASGTVTDTATAEVYAISGTTITGGASDEILYGSASADTLVGNAGADVLLGNAGNDSLSGGTGADRLEGGADNDVLDGDSENDLLIGGAGNDTLTGGTGADTFAWQFADRGSPGTPRVDTITDFDSVTKGDKLDLRDLLQGEIANPALQNLESFLHFEKTGANETTLHISSTGQFSGSNWAGTTDQRIVLQGADLTANNTLSDQQIINDLLTKGKLQTD